jgi:hypothetical protein
LAERNAEHDGRHRSKFRDPPAAFTPNPAKPEPRTSPGNPNLETRNPKQQKTERAKRSSSDVGGLNYFRVRIFTLFRNV